MQIARSQRAQLHNYCDLSERGFSPSGPHCVYARVYTNKAAHNNVFVPTGRIKTSELNKATSTFMNTSCRLRSLTRIEILFFPLACFRSKKTMAASSQTDDTARISDDARFIVSSSDTYTMALTKPGPLFELGPRSAVTAATI